MAPPLMNHRSSLEYKRRPYIAAMATMSTPQKIRVGRRYKKAQRVLPRVLLSIVLVYVVGLCVYFGKYRVRPRHHTAPELPAVLREGEIEMASARRLLCSAAPLREDDEGAGGESGGARIAASEAPTTTTTTTTQTITPIKRGSFLGQQKVFAPGPTRVAPGQDGGGAHPAARVFLLTGASASTPGTADLLSHFLAHYVARGGVPASHVLVVIHTRGGERGDDAAATRELVALCEAAGVFFEVWEGEALLFSAVAHHWEHHLANVADDNDWVVLADLDEHAQVTNEGMNLPQFLGKVDALGYSLVHGDWIDRVSDGGALIAPPRAEPSWPPPETNPSGSSSPMSDAFPLQCTINACDVKGKMTGESAGDYDNVKGPGPNGGGGGGVGESSLNGLRHYSTLAGVVGGGQRVYAHKALHPILDVRTLQDFGLDDVVTASRLTRDHVNAYPIPMKVNHYQWHERTTTQLTRRAREYAACNLLEQERETTRLLARIYANSEVMSDKVCPEISCYRAGAEPAAEKTPPPSAPGANSASSAVQQKKNHIPTLYGDGVGNGNALKGYGPERRVVIFSTVWNHVDGVSRTMKRLASHLKNRADSSVFVMSPDLTESDFAEASNSHRFHVSEVPAIPVPGRPEYKMAAPLQARQRAALETYAPHVVHVAAPDMLGHSAVRWAADFGVCSVCSYHTAYDTYLQYYRVGMLAAPLRQMLSGFYSSCDVVATPSYAAAEHLAEMGVPRERMGFFPRGINTTEFSPGQRSLTFRKEVMGVGGRRGGRGGGGGGGGGSRRQQRGLKELARTEDGEVVILWVARIVREKGLGTFVRTIAALLQGKNKGIIEGLPPFRVVIAGDGPDLPWTRKQLEGFPEVKILGHAGGGRLSRIYASGDIFYFPSRTEVIPNNLIEAMASGLAVVTDDVGVNRAIVRDGVTGVLVKDTAPLPADVTSYVETIAGLLRDPDRRAKMAAAARESTTGLTWKRTFASLRRSYDRCRPGRPYARHADVNIPGSKANLEAKNRVGGPPELNPATGAAPEKTGGGGGGSNAVDATPTATATAKSTTSRGLGISGALLGISAAAGGGGSAAAALAYVQSAVFTPRHHHDASHHASTTSAAAAAVSTDLASSDASNSGVDIDTHPERVAGSGPGAVNRGGVSERDVIVDAGAPPGSLLYRLSYGMTGGYARSAQEARADDEAIAAVEAVARQEAAAALSGSWSGLGGLTNPK